MTDPKESNDSKPMAEQVIYADMLFWGAWAGIFLLVITYFLYGFGVIAPHIEIELIPQYWGHGLHEYLVGTKAPQGWGWASLLHRGDYANFIGLALLALLTIFCYLVLIRAYFNRKDKIYTTICVLEVLVLSLAASGILGGGGH